MCELARHAGRAGRLTLPSGHALPIADWEFATIEMAPRRLVTRGSFTVADPIERGLGPVQVGLHDDDQRGGLWRGEIALEVGDAGRGRIQFRARHEFVRVGPRASTPSVVRTSADAGEGGDQMRPAAG